MLEKLVKGRRVIGSLNAALEGTWTSKLCAGTFSNAAVHLQQQLKGISFAKQSNFLGYDVI